MQHYNIMTDFVHVSAVRESGAEYFEVDIILTDDQQHEIEEESQPFDPHAPQRAITRRSDGLWPNGKVPYYISSSLSKSHAVISSIVIMLSLSLQAITQGVLYQLLSMPILQLHAFNFTQETQRETMFISSRVMGKQTIRDHDKGMHFRGFNRFVHGCVCAHKHVAFCIIPT